VEAEEAGGRLLLECLAQVWIWHTGCVGTVACAWAELDSSPPGIGLCAGGSVPKPVLSLTHFSTLWALSLTATSNMRFTTFYDLSWIFDHPLRAPDNWGVCGCGHTFTNHCWHTTCTVPCIEYLLLLTNNWFSSQGVPPGYTSFIAQYMESHVRLSEPFNLTPTHSILYFSSYNQYVFWVSIFLSLTH